MSNVEKLIRTSLFNTIRVETTPSNDAHWMYMHADTPWGVRPCFRTALMEDMWA